MGTGVRKMFVTRTGVGGGGEGEIPMRSTGMHGRIWHRHTIKIITLLETEITTTLHTHTTFMTILLHNAKTVGDTSVINTIKRRMEISLFYL